MKFIPKLTGVVLSAAIMAQSVPFVYAAKSKKVKVYIGIAVYRAGHNIGAGSAERREWRSDANILKKQVQYARKKGCDGFAFFDYQDLKSKKSAKAVKQLKKVLKY